MCMCCLLEHKASTTIFSDLNPASDALTVHSTSKPPAKLQSLDGKLEDTSQTAVQHALSVSRQICLGNTYMTRHVDALLHKQSAANYM